MAACKRFLSFIQIWLFWISIVTFWREPQYPCSNPILTSIHLHLAYYWLIWLALILPTSMSEIGMNGRCGEIFHRWIHPGFIANHASFFQLTFSSPKWRSQKKTEKGHLNDTLSKRVKIGKKHRGMWDYIYINLKYSKIGTKTPKQKYLPHGNLMKPPPPIVRY